MFSLISFLIFIYLFIVQRNTLYNLYKSFSCVCSCMCSRVCSWVRSCGRHAGGNQSTRMLNTCPSWYQ